MSALEKNGVTAAISILGSTLLAFAGHGGEARAAVESATDDLVEVVVTGTLIRGVTPTGSPVIGITGADIADKGYFNATEALRALPQVLNLGATDSQTITAASGVGQNFTGANGVNLRGLGTPSTLNLIDGHRSAPGGPNGQIFDASVVPSLAIERIEVVVDGASALYGSDAVAGVVNIRLKKKMDGASTALKYGGGEDFDQWSASQLYGKTWDTGGVTATFEHTFRSNLLATERPQFYDSNLYHYGPSFVATAASGVFINSPANIQVTSGTYSGIPCTAAAPCFFAIPNQNGTNLTGAALPATPAAVGNQYAGANTRNLWANNTLLPEQKRDTLVATLEQRLSDRINLSGEVLATKRTFLRNAPAATATLAIPNSNPYSPCNLAKANRPGYCGQLATSTISVPYIFSNEIGAGYNSGYSKNATAALSLDVALPHDWNANFGGTYSKNEDDRYAYGTALNANAANPDRTGLAPNSNVTLANGTVVNVGSNVFVNLFNPFIGDGTTTASNQALVSKLVSFTDTLLKFTQKNAVVRLDGPLFSLPGGTVKVATGVEHRIDRFDRVQYSNNAQAQANLATTSNPAGSTDATVIVKTNPAAPRQRTTDALYAELFVPVVGPTNSLPLVQALNLSLAGRFEHTNDYDSSTTPKAGLTWKPFSRLQVNATYGKSFRAPLLTEADPTQGSSASLYINSGWLNFDGTPLAANQVVLTVGGGNPDLQPETATTKTLGFEWQPSFIDGLDASVTWYSIDYTNRITVTNAWNNATDVLTRLALFQPYLIAGSLGVKPSAQQVTDALNYIATNTIGLNTSLGPQPACVTAGLATCASQVVAILDGRIQNAGNLRTNGFDVNLNYIWETRVGRWDTAFNASLINTWKVAITPGATSVERINTNDDAYPLRHRLRGYLGWRKWGYRVGTTVAYTGSYTNTQNVGLGTNQLLQSEPVASSTIFDLNLGYDFGDKAAGLLNGLQIQLNAQNLFDRDPPYVRILSGSNFLTFDPQNSSAIGRQLSLQVQKAW